MEGLSVFQMLKQGTSFRKAQDQALFRDKAESRRKSSLQSLEQVQLEKTMTKFNLSDSEDSEEEASLQNQLKNSSRKRSGSFSRLEEELYKKMQQKREKNLQLLKKHHITITNGEDRLISNFSKLMKRHQINPCILENLRENQYKHPTAIQMAAMDHVLKGRSVLATAPTGSGKTVAYGLGLVQRLLRNRGDKQALVVVPTVELAQQVWRELLMLSKKGSKAGLKVKLVSKVSSNLAVFKNSFQTMDILVTTPLKFLKLVKQAGLVLDRVGHLVLDEADKFFELGLANQMKQILKKVHTNQSVQYCFFSATIQQGVEQLVSNISADFVRIQVGGKNNVLATVEQKLVYTGTEAGKLLQMEQLINQGQFVPPVLIFMQSKERAKELQVQIYNKNIPIESIFNEKDSQERERIMSDFRCQKTWALICTDLLARGIDFKGVELVINYDFPNDMITYVHRVGRTGRGGRPGKALTFFNDEDKPLLRPMANLLKVSGCLVPSWVFSLAAPKQKEKARLKKFPLKRENISGVPDHIKKRQKKEEARQKREKEE